MDSHFHQENKPISNKPIGNKPVCIYSSSFIPKISLKASLKVKNASHRLFSRQAIEVAHKRKVTYVQGVTLKKITPSEYSNGTSLEHNKATPSVLKEASLNHSKVTPLEVAHLDEA